MFSFVILLTILAVLLMRVMLSVLLKLISSILQTKRNSKTEENFYDTDYADIGESIRKVCEKIISNNAYSLGITKLIDIEEFRVDSVSNPILVSKDEDLELIKKYDSDFSMFATYYKIYLSGKLSVKGKDGENLLLECSDIPYFFDKRHKKQGVVCADSSMFPTKELQEFAPITEKEIQEYIRQRSVATIDEKTKNALTIQYQTEIDNVWINNRKNLLKYNVCKAIFGPPIVLLSLFMICSLEEGLLNSVFAALCAVLLGGILISIRDNLKSKEIHIIEEKAKEKGIDVTNVAPPGLRGKNFFFWNIGILAIIAVVRNLVLL